MLTKWLGLKVFKIIFFTVLCMLGFSEIESVFQLGTKPISRGFTQRSVKGEFHLK